MADRRSIPDPNVLADELERLADEWADRNAAAQLLEETAKSVLGQTFLDLQRLHKSVEATNHAARANSAYQDHVRKMVEARREANRAKGRLEAKRAYLDLFRTWQATNRVLMQHPGT